jgi:hypothetical protein
MARIQGITIKERKSTKKWEKPQPEHFVCKKRPLSKSQLISRARKNEGLEKLLKIKDALIAFDNLRIDEDLEKEFRFQNSKIDEEIKKYE